MSIVGSTEMVDGQPVTILVEVDSPPPGAGTSAWGETRTDRARRVIEATRDVFGDGLALARDCAVRTVDSINATAEEIRPDEFEVQLAIKLDAEAGAVLAKLAAGAQMQVTMRWAKA